MRTKEATTKCRLMRPRDAITRRAGHAVGFRRLRRARTALGWIVRRVMWSIGEIRVAASRLVESFVEDFRRQLEHPAHKSVNRFIHILVVVCNVVVTHTHISFHQQNFNISL